MPSNYELALRDAANYACDKAAEHAGRRLQSLRGGRLAFYANVDVPRCRFSVGVIDEYHYLVYQENGFQTFAMAALRGKVVPMIVNGQRIFRRVTKVNEFRPGTKTYWRRSISGELIASTEQRRAWVHPGMPPKHFVLDGTKDALTERAGDLMSALMRDVEENYG